MSRVQRAAALLPPAAVLAGGLDQALLASPPASLTARPLRLTIGNFVCEIGAQDGFAKHASGDVALLERFVVSLLGASNLLHQSLPTALVRSPDSRRGQRIHSSLPCTAIKGQTRGSARQMGWQGCRPGRI